MPSAINVLNNNNNNLNYIFYRCAPRTYQAKYCGAISSNILVLISMKSLTNMKYPLKVSTQLSKTGHPGSKNNTTYILDNELNVSYL